MYEEMLQFVKESLIKNDGEVSQGFRYRSDHIKRVFTWAKRLCKASTDINEEAVLIAATFHDVGYGNHINKYDHAQNGAIICENYLKTHGYEQILIEKVVYLVKNHSRKDLMHFDSPKELIVLMEADLLDETGAMSIVWDCMNQDKSEKASFENTYQHILKYSYPMVSSNPMMTPMARSIWEDKQALIKAFVNQLAYDLND